MDATVPFKRGQGPGHEHPGGPQGRPVEAAGRSDRVEHREQLYSVIRESMVRSGVLSSGYKFKVLSLDPNGRQFLVMIDLARASSNDLFRQSEIEALVAQTAKMRFGILVSAIYWRMNEHVAVGQPQMRTAGAASAPAPLTPIQPVASSAVAASAAAPTTLPSIVSNVLPESPACAPVALPEHVVAPVAAPVRPAGSIAVPPSRFEPIQADEVEAFRRALAGAVSTARAESAARAAGQATAQAAQRQDEGLFKPRPSLINWPKRKATPHLTGYEDTEAFDMRERAPALSNTQYGELN